MRRYPLSLLVEAAGCSEAALGRMVGLSGTTLKNARLTGFTEQAADRYAIRAGLHPFEVWPSMPEDGRRDQWAARARRRWATNPEHRAARTEYMRRYRADAARVIATQKRAWSEANRERVRAANRDAMRRLRARRKAEAA